MKGIAMRSFRIALTGVVLLAGLTGCRNRVAEERDALWKQSREQQAELDRKNAELQAIQRAEQLRAQAPAPAPAPAPGPTAPAPAPAPAPQPRVIDVGG